MMRENQSHTELSNTAVEILIYLDEHPGAQDTIEGIARWWLLERQILSQTAFVRSAIKELTAGGFIAELKTGDSKSLYQLNKRKIDQVKSLLRNRKPINDQG